jgi:long-subunit fatty acid transport protein
MNLSRGVGLAGLCALISTAALLAQAPASLDAFGLLVAQQSRPSFTIIGAGARPAGMGGAFTALADDASAVSFNPAGLALLVRPEASLVLDGLALRQTHQAFTTFEPDGIDLYGESQTSFSTQGFNFASFTVPLTVAERNLSLQWSYHRVIDFDLLGRRTFEETDTSGVPLAVLQQRIDQRGEIYTLSMAAAYQLTQRASLGLTVSRWSGDWSFVTETSETELAGGEPESLRFAQDNAWRGWNYTLGGLLRYRYLHLGASFRSGFKGDYQVASRLTTNFESPFPDSSRSRGTLEWPNSWTVGVAVIPWDTWVLTWDYSQFDWDDMVIRGFGTAGSEPLNFFDLQPATRSRTRNTSQVRFGSEYTFFPGRSTVAVRAGAFREPQPQLLTPSDEENSRRGGSVGFGWRRGGFAIDFAYQRAAFETRILQFVDPGFVADGEVTAQAEGNVRTRENRFFLSFLYQMESRDTLKKALHFLFVGPNPPPEGRDEKRGDEERGDEERGVDPEKPPGAS